MYKGEKLKIYQAHEISKILQPEQSVPLGRNLWDFSLREKKQFSHYTCTLLAFKKPIFMFMEIEECVDQTLPNLKMQSKLVFPMGI